MRPDCDVIVTGAGMVGLAMAALLGRAGFAVRLLESGSVSDTPPVTGSLRVSALSHGSVDLLRALGAWQRIPHDKITPYSSMRVWDAADDAFGDRALTFYSADMGALDLGCIVENQWIQWALTQLVLESDNVVLHEQAALGDVVIEPPFVRAFCGDHQQYAAALVVGADGANSRLRDVCHIEVQRKSYDQLALVCNIRPEKSHQHTAWQRFLPTGPVAFLPIANGECSIVWSTSEPDADRLQQLEPEAFEHELARASDHVLGAVTLTSARASFPLSMQNAVQYVAPGIALIGDAAHVVHPLAGQGVNLGFGDAEALARELQAGRGRGDQCGDMRALRAFARERTYENRKMMLALDNLHRLFSARQPWLVSARSLGLGLVNNAPLLKQFFAHEALG